MVFIRWNTKWRSSLSPGSRWGWGCRQHCRNPHLLSCCLGGERCGCYQPGSAGGCGGSGPRARPVSGASAAGQQGHQVTGTEDDVAVQFRLGPAGDRCPSMATKTASGRHVQCVPALCFMQQVAGDQHAQARQRANVPQPQPSACVGVQAAVGPRLELAGNPGVA